MRERTYPSIYLSTHPSTHPYRSIPSEPGGLNLSVWMMTWERELTHPSTHPSIYLPIHIAEFHPSQEDQICLCEWWHERELTHPSAHPSIYLPIHLPIHIAEFYSSQEDQVCLCEWWHEKTIFWSPGMYAWMDGWTYVCTSVLNDDMRNPSSEVQVCMHGCMYVVLFMGEWMYVIYGIQKMGLMQFSLSIYSSIHLCIYLSRPYFSIFT